MSDVRASVCEDHYFINDSHGMRIPGGTVTPRAGDILHVTRDASVQFTTPIFFRVIRVHDWPTYDGWLWLDGYQLNAAGDAVERRSIFVRAGGLRMVRQNVPAGPGVAAQQASPGAGTTRANLQDRPARSVRPRAAGVHRTPAVAAG